MPYFDIALHIRKFITVKKPTKFVQISLKKMGGGSVLLMWCNLWLFANHLGLCAYIKCEGVIIFRTIFLYLKDI